MLDVTSATTPCNLLSQHRRMEHPTELQGLVYEQLHASIRSPKYSQIVTTLTVQPSRTCDSYISYNCSIYTVV